MITNTQIPNFHFNSFDDYYSDDTSLRPFNPSATRCETTVFFLHLYLRKAFFDMAWSQLPFRMLEAYLVTRLLQSPYFHRFVRNVHGRIQQVRDPAYREAVRAAKAEGEQGAPKEGLRLYAQLFREEFQKSEWGWVSRRR